MKRTILWLCLIGSFLAGAPGALCAGNNCLEFDGDSSMAVVKPVDGLKSMDGAVEFTFEAWIRPRSQGESGRGRILQQINGHIYWYLSDDTRFGFRAGRKAGWRLSNEGAIHYWEWQHIAVSSDGDFMRYFINGKLVRRFRKTITLETTDGDLAIGNGFGEDTKSRGYDGWIDELRISNRCLYPGEFTPARSLDYDSATVMLFHFNEHLTDSVALDATTFNAEIILPDPLQGHSVSPRRTPVE